MKFSEYCRYRETKKNLDQVIDLVGNLVYSDIDINEWWTNEAMPLLLETDYHTTDIHLLLEKLNRNVLLEAGGNNWSDNSWLLNTIKSAAGGIKSMWDWGREKFADLIRQGASSKQRQYEKTLVPKTNSWLRRTARRWWHNEPMYTWQQDPSGQAEFNKHELVSRLSKVAKDINGGINILHDRVSAFLNAIESAKDRYKIKDFGMTRIIEDLKRSLEEAQKQLEPFINVDLDALYGANSQSSITSPPSQSQLPQPTQQPQQSTQSQPTQSTPRQLELPF